MFFTPLASSRNRACSGLDGGEPHVFAARRFTLETYRYLYVKAFHGSANTATVRWQIARCAGLDEVACDAAGSWTVVMDEVDAVRERPIDWTEQLVDPGANQAWTLGLEVWNPAAPQLALYDYVHVDFQPLTPQTP